ncbi:toprim domain-containing protein [Candidatus Woesearchaeota archaeon]|nr:MAG: toprim domain-containing protein [Candidatus Woesearchaeota archaeon]
MQEAELLLSALERTREKNILVIVEGKKDQAALERLGIRNILAISRTPLYKITDRIIAREKTVILLVDLDTEGRKIYHKLAQELQKHKIKIDNTLRDLLFQTPLRHIEGLDTYLRTQDKHPSDL